MGGVLVTHLLKPPIFLIEEELILKIILITPLTSNNRPMIFRHVSFILNDQATGGVGNSSVKTTHIWQRPRGRPNYTVIQK